ncbi:DUF4157 domain-containing protein, partial [bacterium]|nr:DUF4157 domain-containing protein [bacterium]
IQGIFIDGKRSLLLQPLMHSSVIPDASVGWHPVQAKATHHNAFPIQALPPSGPGQPLPEEVKSKMETALGADFSKVRIHVGQQAPSIGALAYTQGSDIYFAPGQYNPKTYYGQQLLGHELTHVLQQRSGRVHNPFGSGVAVVQDPSMEAEAEHMGMRAAAYQLHVQGKTLPGSVQRPTANHSSVRIASMGLAQCAETLGHGVVHCSYCGQPNRMGSNMCWSCMSPLLTEDVYEEPVFMPNPLHVECQPQKKTNWCWAAVAQAVIQYYEKRVVSQEDLADQFTHGQAYDEEADPWAALGNHASEAREHSMIPWEHLTREIDKGCPILGYVGPKHNAHYILIVGYTGRSSRDPNRRYIILDPKREGKRQSLSYDELKNYHGMYRGSVYTKK